MGVILNFYKQGTALTLYFQKNNTEFLYITEYKFLFSQVCIVYHMHTSFTMCDNTYWMSCKGIPYIDVWGF